MHELDQLPTAQGAERPPDGRCYPTSGGLERTFAVRLTKRVGNLRGFRFAAHASHRRGLRKSAAETVLLELQAATAVCAFLAPEKKQLREQDQKTMRVAALHCRSLAAAPKPREACAPCATQPQRAKSTAVKRMPAAPEEPLWSENVRGSIYGEPQPVPTEFRNVDGERLEDGRYAAFREESGAERRRATERLHGPCQHLRLRHGRFVLPSHRKWC